MTSADFGVITYSDKEIQRNTTKRQLNIDIPLISLLSMFNICVNGGMNDDNIKSTKKKHGDKGKGVKGSQLYLELDGKQYDVLLKDIEHDSMKNQIVELDFMALVKGEKVHSVAEIVLHNKEKVVEGALEQLLTEISYKALPEALIDKIDVDCGNLRVGDTIKVSDLEIASDQNIEIMTHLDAPVVSVIASHNVLPDAEEETEDK